MYLFSVYLFSRLKEIDVSQCIAHKITKDSILTLLSGALSLPLILLPYLEAPVIFNMGVYGGLGPMTNAVLWVEAVIFAVFAGLRLYTRKHILNSVGLDDYLVLIALVRTTNRNTTFVMHFLTYYRFFISFTLPLSRKEPFTASGNYTLMSVILSSILQLSSMSYSAR